MYNRLRPPPPLNLNPQFPPSLHSPVSPYLSPRFFPDVSSNILRDLHRMKLTPAPLPPIPTGTMDRLPAVPIPFSPDFLWRYGSLGFPPVSQAQPPSSPLLDYKSQLPPSLVTDPRLWTREDVNTFLRWAEREYDLQSIDLEKFQMNGKAMCLLTRSDLSERAPGSGDVLHNVLQLLVRDSNLLHRCLPSSPITPTSRHHYPVSPISSHPSTPNWTSIAPNASDHFHSAQQLAHLMVQTNSVTLSPAPSLDSQAGSPQADSQQSGYGHTIFNGSNGSSSPKSESEEDSYSENGRHQNTSPPNTPSAYSLPVPVPYSNNMPKSPKEAASPSFKSVREFFPNEQAETSATNGRLLWDFLQQLLNEPTKKYVSFIAWKNRDTGIFKIVDPPGLAKLWGLQKNHLSMNYDKMSRALRYYYRVNILKKVQGERHCYQFFKTWDEMQHQYRLNQLIKRQRRPKTRPKLNLVDRLKKSLEEKKERFLRNSAELKNIKNISQLKQQVSPPIRATSSMPTTKHVQSPTFNHISIKNEPSEPIDYDDKPTDLSMDVPTDLSSNSTRHVNIVCSPDTPNLKDSPHFYFKEEK